MNSSHEDTERLFNEKFGGESIVRSWGYEECKCNQDPCVCMEEILTFIKSREALAEQRGIMRAVEYLLAVSTPSVSKSDFGEDIPYRMIPDTAFETALTHITHPSK